MLPELITAIPGPRSRELAVRLRAAESRNVTYVDAGFPVFWERAEGINVWDADGNRFLDLTSAFAVAGLGHGAPALRAALHAQTDRLIHGMGDVHPTELKVRLCEALCAVTYGRWTGEPARVILASAGFEAVEAALKTALLHTGRAGVIAFGGGYHGLGYGALEVGGLPRFREPFQAQLREFATILPYPKGQDANLETLETQLRAAMASQPVGCMLVEPIQGRGGDIVPPREFLPLLRRLCDERGVLLILDEIYTGFHRTGAMFACEHSGVVPDLICLGKALTGGFPLSACVGRREVMEAWPESDGEALHTSTFLGHPLGCAMALAALAEHAKPETAAQVAHAGAQFRRALLDLRSPIIREVRGSGLMLGVELDGPSSLVGQIVKAALRDGILLLGGGAEGNVLSFSPPFAISDDEIDFVCSRLQEYLTSLPGSIS